MGSTPKKAIMLLHDNYWRESVALLHSAKSELASLPEQQKRDALIALGIGYLATSNFELARTVFAEALPYCSSYHILKGIIEGAIHSAAQGKSGQSIPVPTATSKNPHEGRLVPLEAKVLQLIFFRLIYNRSTASIASGSNNLLQAVTREVFTDMGKPGQYETMWPESFDTGET